MSKVKSYLHFLIMLSSKYNLNSSPRNLILRVINIEQHFSGFCLYNAKITSFDISTSSVASISLLSSLCSLQKMKYSELQTDCPGLLLYYLFFASLSQEQIYLQKYCFINYIACFLQIKGLATVIILLYSKYYYDIRNGINILQVNIFGRVIFICQRYIKWYIYTVILLYCR